MEQTVTLAASYARMGNLVEAKYYIGELLRFTPRMSHRALRKNPMFIRPEQIEKLVEGIRLPKRRLHDDYVIKLQKTGERRKRTETKYCLIHCIEALLSQPSVN